MYRTVYIHHLSQFGDVGIHIEHEQYRQDVLESILCSISEYHRNNGSPPETTDIYLYGLVGTCMSNTVGFEYLSEDQCERLHNQFWSYAVNFVTYLEWLMKQQNTQDIYYRKETYNRMIVLA